MSEAKKRALKAHRAAYKADTRMKPVYDRWLSGTLLAVGDIGDQTVADEMFKRLAILFEITVDMKGWPEGIVAGLTVPVQPRKLTYPRAGHGQ